MALEMLPPDKNTFLLDRRVYTDKAGNLVEADDPARLILVGNTGAAIPMAQAVSLGLATVGGKALGTPTATKIVKMGATPDSDGGGTEPPDADEVPGGSQGPLSDGTPLPGTEAPKATSKAVTPKANK